MDQHDKIHSQFIEPTKTIYTEWETAFFHGRKEYKSLVIHPNYTF